MYVCMCVCVCVWLQYFYSIKDISVGGQCICYGHARYCPVDPVTRVSQAAAFDLCAKSAGVSTSYDQVLVYSAVVCLSADSCGN